MALLTFQNLRQDMRQLINCIAQFYTDLKAIEYVRDANTLILQTNIQDMVNINLSNAAQELAQTYTNNLGDLLDKVVPELTKMASIPTELEADIKSFLSECQAVLLHSIPPIVAITRADTIETRRVNALTDNITQKIALITVSLITPVAHHSIVQPDLTRYSQNSSYGNTVFGTDGQNTIQSHQNVYDVLSNGTYRVAKDTYIPSGTGNVVDPSHNFQWLPIENDFHSEADAINSTHDNAVHEALRAGFEVAETNIPWSVERFYTCKYNLTVYALASKVEQTATAINLHRICEVSSDLSSKDLVFTPLPVMTITNPSPTHAVKDMVTYQFESSEQTNRGLLVLLADEVDMSSGISILLSDNYGRPLSTGMTSFTSSDDGDINYATFERILPTLQKDGQESRNEFYLFSNTFSSWQMKITVNQFNCTFVRTPDLNTNLPKGNYSGHEYLNGYYFLLDIDNIKIYFSKDGLNWDYRTLPVYGTVAFNQVLYIKKGRSDFIAFHSPSTGELNKVVLIPFCTFLATDRDDRLDMDRLYSWIINTANAKACAYSNLVLAQGHMLTIPYDLTDRNQSVHLVHSYSLETRVCRAHANTIHPSNLVNFTKTIMCYHPGSGKLIIAAQSLVDKTKPMFLTSVKSLTGTTQEGGLNGSNAVPFGFMKTKGAVVAIKNNVSIGGVAYDIAWVEVNSQRTSTSKQNFNIYGLKISSKDPSTWQLTETQATALGGMPMGVEVFMEATGINTIAVQLYSSWRWIHPVTRAAHDQSLYYLDPNSGTWQTLLGTGKSVNNIGWASSAAIQLDASRKNIMYGDWVGNMYLVSISSPWQKFAVTLTGAVSCMRSYIATMASWWACDGTGSIYVCNKTAATATLRWTLPIVDGVAATIVDINDRSTSATAEDIYVLAEYSEYTILYRCVTGKAIELIATQNFINGQFMIVDDATKDMIIIGNYPTSASKNVFANISKDGYKALRPIYADVGVITSFAAVPVTLAPNTYDAYMAVGTSQGLYFTSQSITYRKIGGNIEYILDDLKIAPNSTFTIPVLPETSVSYSRYVRQYTDITTSPSSERDNITIDKGLTSIVITSTSTSVVKVGASIRYIGSD